MDSAPILINPALARDLGDIQLEAMIIVDAECTIESEERIQRALDSAVHSAHPVGDLGRVSYFRHHHVNNCKNMELWRQSDAGARWANHVGIEATYAHSEWVGGWIPKSVFETTVSYGRNKQGRMVVYLEMPAEMLMEAIGYLDVVEEIYWGYNGRLPKGTKLGYLAADFESIPYEMAESTFCIYQMNDPFIDGRSFDLVTMWQESLLGGLRWKETLSAFNRFVEELGKFGEVVERHYSPLFARNLFAEAEDGETWKPDLTLLPSP